MDRASLKFDRFMFSFLEHHGVKGMKWGVRRERPSSKTTPSDSKITQYQKHPKSLSDHELNKRIKRMELEKKYLDMSTDVHNSSRSQGKKFLDSLLEHNGKTVVNTIVATTTAILVRKGLDLLFKKTPIPVKIPGIPA